mmetsp:Transcript_21093/g.46272  ORF Transcript_21093/g.46272 Transcript_21093/m.46272 type:complete len:492 (-) Transcript_21093:471-1946(-)
MSAMGVLARTAMPVARPVTMSRHTRPAQARAAAVKSPFHGKAQLGSRATLRGGLLNLNKANRAALPRGKGRQTKVVTQAGLGETLAKVWSGIVGLELEAVAMEEHFAAVVADVCNNLVQSWYQHGGLAVDAMISWSLKKALLWFAVIYAIRHIQGWLTWVVNKLHLNDPDEDKVQDSIISQVIMAAVAPIKRAMLGGVILSTVHPPPIHLGVRINHLIGRPGCLIGELKIPQVLYIGCAIWYVMLAKEAIINHIKKEAEDKQKIMLIDQLMTVVIMVMGVLAIGEVTHLPLSSMAALVGGSGFALAWASQQLVGNFLAAVVLRLTQPYSVNEVVNLGGVSGFVKDVGFFSTRILTFEQQWVSVPNSHILGSNIVNMTRGPYRNCRITFGVRPEDLSKCQKICAEVVEMMHADEHVADIKEGPTSPRCAVEDVTPDGTAVKIGMNCMMPNYGGPETTAAYKAGLIFKMEDIVKRNGAQLAFRKYNANVNLLN